MTPAAAELSETTWQRAAGASLLVVPVGSTEQHGPHLPLDTDAVIARAVALGVAERLRAAEQVAGGEPTVWVAPPLALGSSGEHQAFAGTLSIGTEVLTQVLIELARSARTWVPRVAFVNAHGGNVVALERAVGQLRAEGHDVSWHACRTEDVDLHAGRTETSLMLHLQPWTVRLDRAEPGDRRPLAEILPTLIRSGVAAVSPNGVLGDPTGATAAEGEQTLAAMVEDVLRGVRCPQGSLPRTG